MPTISLQMTIRSFKKMTTYLEEHEADIATDKDGMGALRGLYAAIYQDAPSGSEPNFTDATE